MGDGERRMVDGLMVYGMEKMVYHGEHRGHGEKKGTTELF